MDENTQHEEESEKALQMSRHLQRHRALQTGIHEQEKTSVVENTAGLAGQHLTFIMSKPGSSLTLDVARFEFMVERGGHAGTIGKLKEGARKRMGRWRASD